MKKKLVSVIITTYNRPSEVLKQTIPSYLMNDCIGEVVIVDDASTLNSDATIMELQKQFPQIKYIKKTVNAKLPAARNTGITNAKYDYIHFGDDDNIIMPHAIDLALATMNEYGADVVGIRPLLLDSMEELDNIPEFLHKYDQMNGELVDMSKLKANFYLNPGKVIEVPLCHSAFLIKADLARLVLFDEKILGNAYREETDFLVRVKATGAKIVFNPFIYTLNLPRDVATGGCHSGPKYSWYIWAMRNNWYFLNKNHAILKNVFGVKSSPLVLQFYFILDFAQRGVNKLFRKLLKVSNFE
ncbi:MAG: glycosyltransferase family 2 protein [Burkholderiales bacterium]|nr:glycosyltransferase family 2 protein [Burkholderiales bacterium]